MEEFIITLRESLEAALIIGIIFSYLKKTDKSEFGKFVYIGIFLGILGSIIGAIGFHKLVGNFDGVAEQIFEGTTMVIGAILIVYLIVWMANKKEASAAIRDQVNNALDKNRGLGLMLLVFVSILREGVETTLFLSAVVSNQNGISQISAFTGIACGLLIGYGVYLGLRGMNLKYLFSISSALLILFATGLFAHGVHEFQESGLIPILVEHMWNTNNIISSESIFGEFLKSLFGYNANPSLMEVLVYWSALIIMVLIYNKNSSKPDAIKVKA
jgi:high-affinity iron transporter